MIETIHVTAFIIVWAVGTGSLILLSKSWKRGASSVTEADMADLVGFFSWLIAMLPAFGVYDLVTRFVGGS